MSNIQKTIQYLQQSPETRYLTLVNLENNQKLGKANIFLADIPGQDLTQYIKSSLGPISQPTLVWVEIRAKNGSSSLKKEAYKVEISPTAMTPAVTESMPVVYQQPQMAQNYPAPTPVAGLGANFGLGFSDVLKMHNDSSRLEDKIEQLNELKEEYKELKKEKNLLEIDNRELKTQLSTSEAREKMAVALVKIDSKTFYDSPAFEKLLDKAPEVFASIVAMKTGGASATGALGAALSETKASFLEHMNDNLTDEQVNYLGAICQYIQIESFKNELNNLIRQYANV